MTKEARSTVGRALFLVVCGDSLFYSVSGNLARANTHRGSRADRRFEEIGTNV